MTTLKGSTQYISVHAEGIFPHTGTGRSHNSSIGSPGSTSTSTETDTHVLNIPIKGHLTPSAFEDKWAKVSAAIIKFQPDVILVSAGYDGHINDPLTGSCGVVSKTGFLNAVDYYKVTDALRRLADSLCLGRLVVIMEGGYGCSCRPTSAATASTTTTTTSRLPSGAESLEHCVEATCLALAKQPWTGQGSSTPPFANATLL